MEELEEYLNEGLNQLRLEKKVKSAATARDQWFLRRTRLRFALVFMGIALSCIVLFFFFKHPSKQSFQPIQNRTDSLQPAPPKPDKEPLAPPTTPPKKEETTRPPIAAIQTPDTKNPLDQPLLRGAYETLDAETFQLLDTLIVLTLASPPHEGAGPWKKAIAQIQKGRPEEAKAIVFEMENNHAVDARWLLGLTLLAEGKTEEALHIFQGIRQKAADPRQVLAQMAVVKLQE